MLEMFEQIARDTLERLSRIMTNNLPGLLAALLIFFTTWCLAAIARALLTRIFQGARIDRFLRRTGLDSLLPGEGPKRATFIAAKGTYWAILVGGFLLALSAFDTQLAWRVIEGVLLLLPKLVAAGAILLAGTWVSRYLGRSALVWAFNEGIPHARRMAQAVRVIVIFVTVVVAADYLNFARNVFLASFILLVGGAVLAGGLAMGLGGRKTVERYLESRESEKPEQPDSPVWKHL